MSGLDPVAATTAYIQALPAAARLAASAYAGRAHLIWIAAIGVQLLTCWLVLRTGALARLLARVERGGSRPWLAAPLGVGVGAFAFAALLRLVSAPLDLLAGKAAGDVVSSASLVIAAAGIGAPVLYGVMKRSPRLWPAWTGGALAVLVAGMVWLPYALASGPTALPAMPPGPARDGLVQLIHDTGLPVREIYVSDNLAIDADVTGTPLGARLVISQGMLTRAPPPEIRAQVGHLIGHFRRLDQLSLAVLMGAMILCGAFAVHLLFAPVARWMGAGTLNPADPRGLPVIAAIAVAGFALATVASNNLDRLINVRADQYSLDHAREPDGLARSLLRDGAASDVDPSPLEEIVFYDHPALRGRVLHAMRWKAAHVGSR